MIARIRCAWRGHQYWNPGDRWVCTDCDKELSYEEMVQSSLETRLRDWLQRQHDWWKCPDCGRRFGRHDASIDHLPF